MGKARSIDSLTYFFSVVGGMLGFPLIHSAEAPPEVFWPAMGGDVILLLIAWLCWRVLSRIIDEEYSSLAKDF